jgi:hypothetical protein
MSAGAINKVIRLTPCATTRTRNRIRDHGAECAVALEPRPFQASGPLAGRICVLLAFTDGHLAWVPCDEIQLEQKRVG